CKPGGPECARSVTHLLFGSARIGSCRRVCPSAGELYLSPGMADNPGARRRETPTLGASGLLVQKQLIAIEVFKEHSNTPWASLRFPMEFHSASLHCFVITHAIDGVEGQEREAACLLAHKCQVVGVLRQLESERARVAWQ